MKTKLAMAWLIGLSFGIFAIPAHAFNLSFNTYDRNHDGRWDRTEYYNANRDWRRSHHHHVFLRADSDNGFRKYDRDHDGYLSRGEVREIHSW